MKSLRIYKIALILLVTVAGLTCKSDEDLFVLRDTDYLNFDVKPASQTFTVRTNGVWTVNNGGNSWIKLHPEAGRGNGAKYDVVTVTVLRNNGRERTGKIAINAAGKEIYIDVTQADGAMRFGAPYIVGALIPDELMENISLMVPYSRATGNETFTISVQVSGDGAPGINNVQNHPVELTAEEGEISIPVSGTPTVTGPVTFNFNTTYPDATINSLNARVRDKLFHDGPFLISGFLADPRGTDAPASGASATFPNPHEGNASIHSGPYEYIQFLALEDIDFSATPYSVVTCKILTTEGGAPNADGWAAGGSKSYKFNLTEGTVSKGEFFYVGGTAKALNGYNTCGIVSMMSSKWIRTIAYNDPGASFDGFGNATSGWLNNYNTTGRALDGIAVFEGTDVDRNSTPFDAIFFGNVITNSFDAVNNYGYRIPSNDWYNPINPDTGEAQPMFGQGVNTTFVQGPVNVDLSDYTKMGGIIRAGDKQWLTPREATFQLMTPCVGTDWTIADIESGPGVTRIVD